MNPARLVPLLALLLAGGCATVPGQDRLAERDPLEKINRGIWNVNMTADRILVKPVSRAYRTVAPRPARNGVSNFLANLTEPWSFINNLLQGKTKRAGDNLKRFFENTVIGVGGLFDVATKVGNVPRAPEDFGQTLAHWGVNGGPYLVLPLLGPTTLRDGVGSGVALVTDPVSIGINQADIGRWPKRGFRALQVIDTRAQLSEGGGDAFLKSSLDPYATARSAYLQRRRAAILDQEDSLDAGPPDDDQPAPPAETVATPVASPATAPIPATAAPAPDPASSPPR